MSSLPLTQLRGSGRSFAPDARFATFSVSRGSQRDAGADVDPAAEAYGRGFNDGVAQARAAALDEQIERESQALAIELAFARFDQSSAEELRDRLRQTVMMLCEETILPLAIDADGLVARIEKAVGLLQRSQDERRVLLNPEDAAMIAHRLPADLQIAEDPGVERGALRIETADGGIEDGPAHWRRILSEAFREC